jgi:hypothetical protein
MPSRKISIGSEIDFSPILLPQDPEEEEGVQLLLGMANIVSKEIANNTEIFEEDHDQYGGGMKCEAGGLLANSTHSNIKRSSTASPPLMMDDDDCLFAWSRARAVSIDHSPLGKSSSPTHMKEIVGTTSSLSLPAIVTPVGTRFRAYRKASAKFLAHKAKKEQVKFPKLPQLEQLHQPQQQQSMQTVQEHKRKALKISAEKGTTITTILRKKFSWKNYPGKYLKGAKDSQQLKR